MSRGAGRSGEGEQEGIGRCDALAPHVSRAPPDRGARQVEGQRAMGFPPIQPPLGALPEYGQPYHAWWKQEKQRNPYADAPVFSAREATPGSGSNSTATTRTKSSRRTTSTSSSSRHSYQGGVLGSQPKRFGRSQSARTRGPATGPHAQELQKRVNETLRELEQIKAGTHAVCIAPARPAPRVVPATPRRYVEPVITARRSVPAEELSVGRGPPDRQPHHAVSNGDHLTRRRGNAPAVAAPAPMVSSRLDVAASAPENSTRNRAGMTIEALLTEAGLNQYAGVLTQHGLDFQGILGCTAMQLQQMGMKMGHALRLLSTANRLQGSCEGRSAPSSSAWQALPGEAAAAQRPKMQGEPWSEDEEDALLKARAIYGSRWDAIAGLLPGRSKEECRRHWEQTGSTDNRGDGIIARNITTASTGVSSSVEAPTPTPVPPLLRRMGQQRQTVTAKTGKVMDHGKKASIQHELEAAMAKLESEAEGQARGPHGHNFASDAGGRASLHAESAAYQRRRADAAAVVRRVAGGAGQAGTAVTRRPADTGVLAGARMKPDDDDEIDVLALADAALSAAAQGKPDDDDEIDVLALADAALSAAAQS